MADGSRVECDVCVIGAGPAGIALVHGLLGSGLTVCLLESGDSEPEIRQQDLYRGENVGHPYYPLHTCRFRMLGGSSSRWGGWCRPLEPEDFETRDWVSHSGWPIRARDLEPFYGPAARLFGFEDARFDLGAWEPRMPEPLALEGGDFVNGFRQLRVHHRRLRQPDLHAGRTRPAPQRAPEPQLPLDG